MKVLKYAIILKKDERRYRGQYRIPISCIGKFRKGSYFQVELYSIDNSEQVLAVLTPVESGFGKDVHRVTIRGQLTFTPPKGMFKEETAASRKPRYKTYKVAELPF